MTCTLIFVFWLNSKKSANICQKHCLDPSWREFYHNSDSSIGIITRGLRPLVIIPILHESLVVFCRTWYPLYGIYSVLHTDFITLNLRYWVEIFLFSPWASHFYERHTHIPRKGFTHCTLGFNLIIKAGCSCSND